MGCASLWYLDRSGWLWKKIRGNHVTENYLGRQRGKTDDFGNEVDSYLIIYLCEYDGNYLAAYELLFYIDPRHAVVFVRSHGLKEAASTTH